MTGVSNGMVIGLAIVWVGISAVGVSGQPAAGSPSAKTMKNPVPPTPESIAAGQKLYQKHCKFCHGADAKGNGPMAPEGTHPPNLIGDKLAHGSSEGEIFVVIRDGIGPKYDMKGFKSKLTAPEMWNIVNYLRSLDPLGTKTTKTTKTTGRGQ
jgi:mono/diheme cytochrome c family protein